MPKTDIHVQLTGENGNSLNLTSIVSHALRSGGYPDLAKEVQSRVFKCESYDAVLLMLQEYVEVS